MGRFDGHWHFLFNVAIDSLDLREVSMVGRQFTWANSLPDPTYEKLDHVLMDTDRENKFPLVTVRSLERIERLSDHAPILLTLEHPVLFVENSSSLNLVGYIGRGSTIWSRMYGIDRLLFGPQLRGGTIRCGLYVNTFRVGLDM
jgi:hypothetical protein